MKIHEFSIKMKFYFIFSGVCQVKVCFLKMKDSGGSLLCIFMYITYLLIIIITQNFHHNKTKVL